ncbi:hypothetical protein AYJ54_42890 [Bradyrhizobium centrolobii]|uniref:Uncharacterized protein n=1 Tax=Bradyrhizobium centrolobii TaxID=1505087 RepID=A0A176Z2F1_9BRAD|nr:hypothetical protein [Bradyrhizobium centrolobii]OAF14055.1 hypothetical protein AYJ54_42890 [Bradyrhizobium centrolobii]
MLAIFELSSFIAGERALGVTSANLVAAVDAHPDFSTSGTRVRARTARKGAQPELFPTVAFDVARCCNTQS